MDSSDDKKKLPLPTNDISDVEKNLSSSDEKNSLSERDVVPSLDEPSALEKPSEQLPPHMVFPEGGARAWSVALGTAGVLFCTFGYANAFGVYQEYYQTHQLRHNSPSTISWLGSIQIFFLFGGTLFGGPLFDRYGAKVIWPAAVAYVFSVFMTSLCKEFWQFILAQGILGGLGMGMTMAPGMAATGQYFNKKRGAAMGIAVAGSSLGGVIFPIALSKMLYSSTLGFGWTVRILAFMMTAILGLSCSAIRARLPPRKGQFFILSAFKEFRFLSLVGSMFLIMMGTFIPFFYLPSFAVSHGMSQLLASYLVAILNGASFFGRVVPGILADKFGRLNGLCAAAMASGILALCWQKVTTNPSIIVFAVLYGFCSGAIVSLMSAAMAQVPESPRDIGTYMGMGMFCVSFASLIGPPINGALITHYHGFTQVTIFSGVVIVAGSFCILIVKHANGRGLLSKI